MLTRAQILRALRAAARQLGRAPTRAEFLRLTSISLWKADSAFPQADRAQPCSAILPTRKSHILYLRNLKRSFAAAKSSIHTAFSLDTRGEQMVD